MPVSSKKKGGSYVEAMDAMAEDMMPKPIEDEEEGGEAEGSESPDALIAGIESRLSQLRAIIPGASMDEEEEEEEEMMV